MGLQTNYGRLRVLAWLEGLSLIILVFIAMPLKYIYGNESLTKTIGPVHGALFLVYVFNTLSVSVQQRWKFSQTTWKVLLACIIPFGTFYIDKKILSRFKEV